MCRNKAAASKTDAEQESLEIHCLWGIILCRSLACRRSKKKKKNVGNVNEETFNCSLRNCSYEQACCRCKWEEWYSKKEKKKGANELNKYTEKEMC